MALAANRVVIERVEPELDGGRHAIKRVVGDVVEVEADIFCDGHDKIAACDQVPAAGRAGLARGAAWRSSTTTAGAASFRCTRNARYLYTIEAWRDLFASWRAES